MPRRRWFISFALLSAIGLLFSINGASAQTASQPEAALTFSGRLTDPAGHPVADGVYDFIFTIYATDKDDQALWTETQVGVNVKSGSVMVALGQIVPVAKELTDRGALWLSVSVRGPQEADFTLLNPRRNLLAPDAVSALTCLHTHFTDSWYGASSSFGVSVENGGTGDGIRVYSQSTSNNYAALWAVNMATTGAGTAIYATSGRGRGVYAHSNLGDAIEASTDAAGMSAVYAHTTNGFGLTSRSTNNFGIQTAGGGDASWNDTLGDLFLEGTRGEIFISGNVMELYSNGYIAFDLDNDNNGANQLEVWNGTEVLVFKVDEAGNTVATGTKSASVSTENYGQRLLYAVESPEVWLEDFGSAAMVNGSVTVAFEPIFAETVNLAEDYHVFLTPLGDCALYVSEKTSGSFTVKAIGGQACNIAFDYRIVARRAGYENERLAPVDLSNTSRSTEVQP